MQIYVIVDLKYFINNENNINTINSHGEILRQAAP